MMNIKRNKIKKHHKNTYHGADLILNDSQYSFNAEQYRGLRTNIEFAQANRKLKSILVTSSIPAEGKSTVAANLAVITAQTSQRILLIEADLRKPTVHKTFHLSNIQGLSTILNDIDLEPMSVVQYLPELKLSIIPAGLDVPNPSELLVSMRMKEILTELEQHFDLIIIDTPPITSFADGLILANKVDGVVIVSRYGYTKKEEIRKAKEALMGIEALILGYVLNDYPIQKADRKYAYYQPKIPNL